MSNFVDLEKLHSDDKSYGVTTTTAVPAEVTVKRGRFLQKCVDFMNRMGGEERGIERVLPEEKTDQKPFDNFSGPLRT